MAGGIIKWKPKNIVRIIENVIEHYFLEEWNVDYNDTHKLRLIPRKGNYIEGRWLILFLFDEDLHSPLTTKGVICRELDLSVNFYECCYAFVVSYLLATIHSHGLLNLNNVKVPEYCPSLDDDGVCKTAFELIFAFDEAISLGNKEKVTVQQVKEYCEMDSVEEMEYKQMMQEKIKETKDFMKKKVIEIEKTRVHPTLFLQTNMTSI